MKEQPEDNLMVAINFLGHGRMVHIHVPWPLRQSQVFSNKYNHDRLKSSYLKSFKDKLYVSSTFECDVVHDKIKSFVFKHRG